MARTFVGIDIDGERLRVVALEEAGNELKIVAIVQRDIESSGDTAEMLASILSERVSSAARMAMALPASSVLSRRLTFPFGDRKKIAAAVPLELGARLPTDLTDYHICSLPPHQGDEGHSTVGIAIPTDLIDSTLAPFDELQLPLRHVGIAPFAYVGHLQEQPDDCIIVSVRENDISTLLVQAGEPVSYRASARNRAHSGADIIEQVRRDANSLQKSAALDNLPLLLFGSGLDDELQKLILESMPEARVPAESFDEEILPAQFLPALALARLAASQGRQSFNLRQGEYAFRGSLAPFRRQLTAAAILLCLTLIALTGGAWFSWSRKAASADRLQQQMEAIYLQTFPQAKDAPKDIPLHMTSRLNEARNQSQLLGGPGAAPLPSLEAVSRALPDDSGTFIRELTFDKDGVRLAGRASSFDAVDQYAAALKKELLYNDARISDAKMSIDGKQVEFRIELGFAGQGVQR